MEQPLDLQYFTFCPMHKKSVLGMLCRECQFLTEEEEGYSCSYIRAEGNSEHISAKALIIRLLDYLEQGNTHLTKEELMDLLESQ